VKVSLDRLLAQAKLPWAKNDDGSYSGAPQNGSQSATAKKVCRTLISAVPRVEWIDEFNSRQCKTVLQILGEQMTDASPL
jgi:hypothetical protein